MSEKMEKIIEIKTESLYIPKDEVRKAVPNLDTAPKVHTDGLVAFPVPLGSKIRFWIDGWQFGYKIIEKGNGKEVYVLIPCFDDYGCFYDLVENLSEEDLASNWEVVKGKNIVIYMFECAGFNIIMGNLFAKTIETLKD